MRPIKRASSWMSQQKHTTPFPNTTQNGSRPLNGPMLWSRFRTDSTSIFMTAVWWSILSLARMKSETWREAFTYVSLQCSAAVCCFFLHSFSTTVELVSQLQLRLVSPLCLHVLRKVSHRVFAPQIQQLSRRVGGCRILADTMWNKFSGLR